MQVFTRQARLVRTADALAWGAAITQKAHEVTGLPVSFWSAAVGLPPGTVAWTVATEGFAQMGEATEKGMADAGYLDLLEQGATYIQEMMPDRMHQVIHGEITGQAEIGSYLGSVQAVATEGNGVAAGAWAVEIADLWASITGIQPVVMTTVSGPMFEYSWAVRHDTAASIDEATAKTMASAEYAAAIDRAGGLFHPGAAQVYARRVA